MSDEQAPITVTARHGHTVQVDATRLAEAAEAMRTSEAETNGLTVHVTEALLPISSFGDVPGGSEAGARLQTAVRDHLRALTDMGLSLGDLASRIDAAAMLGSLLDPATRRASAIPQ
ncbi:hypothetical protein GB931_00350 [Modestobacter sp. I12A-02628]|uniref:Uncharacterized protein n=1 Tax=Goekera deserti TaxID=2497753 RepID=A0A7K3WJR5_9ACTN|nr:hypothetical protein [Goekera deserti]MPQ96398.1 hypothetical protein [Goekera deserti]NDI47289.1 hypothetical protein [Goekera deserti]NEL56119.1 hypothetical protein [Goekera deserti]